jgi:probable HAF family extracellular repeat protein
MSKLAILSAALALVAVTFYGCDQPNPTEPPRDASEPTFAQGGRDPGPYTATEVPVMPGKDECWFPDIADDGSLVGSCQTFVCCDAECEYEFVEAVIWRDGEYTVLPSLGGCTANAGWVNSRGWIVGTARTTDLIAHGVLWTDDQTIVDLGNPLGGSTYGSGINNRGQVVLTSCSDPWSCRGILWEDGATTDLGDLGGGTTTVNGINNNGQIVGSSTRADGQYRAYLWQNGRMQDLGTLGGDYSRAFAINNRGQVVGEARVPSGDMHAFVWEKGEMTDLGVVGAYFTRASDINGAGIAIGTESNYGVGSRASVWHDGRISHLSGTVSGVQGINSRGQIVGYEWRPDPARYAQIVWDR